MLRNELPVHPHHEVALARPPKRSASVGQYLTPTDATQHDAAHVTHHNEPRRRSPHRTENHASSPSLPIRSSHSPNGRVDSSMSSPSPYRHAASASQHYLSDTPSSTSSAAHKFDIKRLLSKPASSSTSSPVSPLNHSRTLPSHHSPGYQSSIVQQRKSSAPGVLQQAFEFPSVDSAARLADPREPEIDRLPISTSYDATNSASHNPSNSFADEFGVSSRVPRNDYRNRSLPRNHKLSELHRKKRSIVPHSDGHSPETPLPRRGSKSSQRRGDALTGSPFNIVSLGRVHKPKPESSASSSGASLTPASQVALDYYQSQMEKQRRGTPHGDSIPRTNAHSSSVNNSSGEVVAVGNESDWDSPRSSAQGSPATKDKREAVEGTGEGGGVFRSLSRKVSTKLLKRPKQLDLWSDRFSPVSGTPMSPRAQATAHEPIDIPNPDFSSTPRYPQRSTRSKSIDERQHLRNKSAFRLEPPSEPIPLRSRMNSGEKTPVLRQFTKQQQPSSVPAVPTVNAEAIAEQPKSHKSTFMRLVRKLSSGTMRESPKRRDPEAIPPVPALPSERTTPVSKKPQPTRRVSSSTDFGSPLPLKSQSVSTSPSSDSHGGNSSISRVLKYRATSVSSRSQTTNASRGGTDTASSAISKSSRPSTSSSHVNVTPELAPPVPAKFETYVGSSPRSFNVDARAEITSSPFLHPMPDRLPSRQSSFSNESQKTPKENPDYQLFYAPVTPTLEPMPTQMLTPTTPTTIKKHNSLKKKNPLFRERTSSSPNSPSSPARRKDKRPHTAGGVEETPPRFGKGMRSTSMDGAPPTLGVMVKRDGMDPESGGLRRKTEDEKDAMWNELMKRSALAPGGTLHASVGVKLASDELVA